MAAPIARAATESDWATLLDLFESVAAEGRWIGAEPPIDRAARVERWKAAQVAPDKVTLVVEMDGGIVGWAGVEHRVPGLVTIGMAVAAPWRGKGVGTVLLRACIEWARSTGGHKITLEVWPHNDAAVRLYEKFGFEREGLLRKQYRRKSGELWDSMVMGLLLDPDAG